MESIEIEELDEKVWNLPGIPVPFSLAVVAIDGLGLGDAESVDAEIIRDNLTSDEISRFREFVYPKRRGEWLAGRLASKRAVRKICSRNKAEPTLGMKELVIRVDTNGRPFVSHTDISCVRKLPQISISHSGGLAVAMAVEKGCCGVDIQQITERLVKVKERFAFPFEEEILADRAADLPEIVRLTMLWSSKEAVKKASAGWPLPGFLGIRMAGLSKKTAVSGLGEYYLLDFTCPSTRAGDETDGQEGFSTIVIVRENYVLAACICAKSRNERS